MLSIWIQTVRRVAFAASLSVFLALFSGCGKSEHSAVLTLAGSTSIQPFAEKLADAYVASHPDVMINVQGGGSTAGVQAVKEAVADIGMCSRPLKKEEQGLTATIIARDGLAVIVHPSNPVSDLSPEQIRGMFSRAIRNWREVGGPDMELRIITREDGSGTRGAFQEMVMKEMEISDEALVQDSNGAVREVVASHGNIIGYISLGLVDARVKALKVGGVSPTEENILAGHYCFVRPFLFLTNGPPEGQAARFVEFALSPEGQGLLHQEGLVAAR